MVGQHGGSQEEKWKVANLYRLHGSKKSMPKGPVPHASDRPAGGRNSGPSLDEFLDAFQGYHQISLALEDQEKTAFETHTGNYHYKVMLFGLKNAGSTY